MAELGTAPSCSPAWLTWPRPALPGGSTAQGIRQDETSRAANPSANQLHECGHELAGQEFGNSYFCGLFIDKAFKMFTTVVC